MRIQNILNFFILERDLKSNTKNTKMPTNIESRACAFKKLGGYGSAIKKRIAGGAFFSGSLGRFCCQANLLDFMGFFEFFEVIFRNVGLYFSIL